MGRSSAKPFVLLLPFLTPSLTGWEPPGLHPGLCWVSGAVSALFNLSIDPSRQTCLIIFLFIQQIFLRASHVVAWF